jgi:hypothetical protein
MAAVQPSICNSGATFFPTHRSISRWVSARAGAAGMRTAAIADLLLLREQQRQFGSQLPGWAAGWTNGIVIAGNACTHGLVTRT